MDFESDADSLNQPTRASLFELLCELKRPAATDELAKELGRHPNGVRKHLEQMQDSGLVVRQQERIGRGRPRDIWAVSPRANPGGHRPTAYAELSQWLAKIIAGGPVDPESVEARGHEIGRTIADGESHGSPRDRFQDALAAMGFQPSLEPSPPGTLDVCLNNCPYRDVVRERQPMICALHRGITTGLIESIDPSAQLTRFEIKDPDRAGCQISVRGDLIDSPA